MESFRIQLRKNWSTFAELNEMEKARLSLKQRKFTYKRRFRSRRRPRSPS